ncbi:GH25 family lysozyme [Rhodococcus sp. IEGM 1409]|uniref:GH25 family lysozyme n=1 Tax=Rhodococcus sp. IEGM 1409 TaxID=3047082 RepID=UPI0024B7652C|nr:GH25 family lysozyme [Rhodococcus sp. IEGM 1409]MDI9900265.1 GH25 family lysozyme [Rhodococcus sp. IEGM 1409]
MAAKFWPLERGLVVTSGFGSRWGTTHWGTDFGKDGGSGGLPVFAVQGGTVVNAGAASGFGQWVVVDHPTADGSGTTVYGHVIPEVAVGARVEAGQRIARINPVKGAGNGNVDPHLHLEWHRSVWSANGADRMDPLPLLDGASYPGEGAPKPEVGGERVTFFGIDIASYQAGLDMSRVKSEGFSYVIAKATEGASYTNPEYRRQRDGARANGLLFGSYHYVKSADSARAQVDRYESVEPDRSIPVMLDHELSSGDVGVLRAVLAEFVARGYRVNLVYLPRWYWSGHIGSPDLSGLPPLMASNYVTGGGFASVLYDRAGGDGSPRWDGYGNNSVAVLQFSDQGRVADYSLDVNAFRGTVEDLAALFGVAPLEVVMSLADQELGKSFPSRSIYRDHDQVVDTLAGFVLNMDARIHEDFVVAQAKLGVSEYVEKVRRVAANGMAGVSDQDSKNRAQAVLDGLAVSDV